MLYIGIKYAVVILTTLISWIHSKRTDPNSTKRNDKWAKPMKWMRQTVVFVFRKQLELEDKIGKQKQQKQLNDGDHINNAPEERTANTETSATEAPTTETLITGEGPKIKLNRRSTIILFTLITTFGLLAVGSALDLTLFSVTHVCTEDPNIDCYPRSIDDAEDAGLNITTDEPIQDCSFWNSEGVSDKVTFVCYQIVLNVELFLAVIGGLSTVFVFTMRAMIRLLLHLSTKGCCTCKCGCIRTGIARYVSIVITSAIELLLAILGLVFGGTGTNIDNTNDTPGVIFLATHVAEILLIFGIMATLLWLPWEDYGDSDKHTEASGQNNI